jgi:hypothetical protein
MDTDFEEAAAGILSYEEKRLRNHAKAELDQWRQNLEYETEIRVLKKLLWDKITRGKAAEWRIKSLSDEPHPLYAYLEECHAPPGVVRNYLNEIREDFVRLQIQAEEGESHVK